MVRLTPFIFHLFSWRFVIFKCDSLPDFVSNVFCKMKNISTHSPLFTYPHWKTHLTLIFIILPLTGNRLPVILLDLAAN